MVTWTYDDGNGNVSAQTQNIVIEDVSHPELTCVEDIVVVANNGTAYIVQETEFDLTSYSDNCDVKYISNSINAEENLEGEELPLGDNSITWTIEDTAGNVKTCSFTVSVSIATSTTDLEAKKAIKVYPNPSSGLVTVEFHTDQVYLLYVYNSAGMLVEQQFVNENQYQLDLSHLENGIYMIQLIINDKLHTRKLIKK